MTPEQAGLPVSAFAASDSADSTASASVAEPGAVDIFVSSARHPSADPAGASAEPSVHPAGADPRPGGLAEFVRRIVVGASLRLLAPVQALDRALHRRWDAGRIRDAVAGRSWDATARAVLDAGCERIPAARPIAQRGSACHV